MGDYDDYGKDWAARDEEVARLRAEIAALIQRLPGGQSVDPQWVADELRKILGADIT